MIFRHTAELIDTGVRTIILPPVGGTKPYYRCEKTVAVSDLRLRTGAVLSGGFFDLDNQYPENQGQSPTCTVYAVLGAIETMLIAHYRDKTIHFDRELYAQVLRDVGILTDDGAYIHEVMEWFVQNPPMDVMGRIFILDRKAPIKRSEIGHFVRAGVPPVIGGFWGWPYYDSNYIWKPKTLHTGFGHATFVNGHAYSGQVVLNDGTPNDNELIVTETSYGRYFGLKKKAPISSGQLFIQPEDFSKIFTPYVFTGFRRDNE